MVWTIPSPWPKSCRRRPSSLYTFLSRGLARDWRWRLPLAFPDFERFYSTGFPAGTPIEVCCVYRFRHVRVHSDSPSSCHNAPRRARAKSRAPGKLAAPGWPLARLPERDDVRHALLKSLFSRSILPECGRTSHPKKTVFKSAASTFSPRPLWHFTLR